MTNTQMQYLVIFNLWFLWAFVVVVMLAGQVIELQPRHVARVQAVPSCQHARGGNHTHPQSRVRARRVVGEEGPEREGDSSGDVNLAKSPQ